VDTILNVRYIGPNLLDDTVHGHFGGRPWYGSDERIDRWWPAALDAWHAALRSRVVAGRARDDGSAREWEASEALQRLIER